MLLNMSLEILKRVPGAELDAHRIEVKRKHNNIYNMADWIIEKKIKSLKENKIYIHQMMKFNYIKFRLLTILMT